MPRRALVDRLAAAVAPPLGALLAPAGGGRGPRATPVAVASPSDADALCACTGGLLLAFVALVALLCPFRIG